MLPKVEALTGRILLKEVYGSSFFHPDHEEFSTLRLFKDQYLASGDNLSVDVSGNTHTVLIPVTGDLIYRNGADDQYIAVGQALVISTSVYHNFELQNPFTDEEINFLHFQIADPHKIENGSTQLVDFELGIDGGLTNILSGTQDGSSGFPFDINIGQFSGREEATCVLRRNAGFFCFVLTGAFEIQGRLLHAYDGLALWQIMEVEMEALSNNATIITVEFPYICV